MTRVLLVDDHPVFRRGLRSLLDAEGIEVLAETSSGEEGARLAPELIPDVVVMDLSLPDLDGLVATARILEAVPDARVLVLSMYNDDAALARALEVGARGYVAKDSPPAEVVAAIRTVAAGGVVVASALAPRVQRLVAGGAVRSASVGEPDFPDLSSRERQVLGLLALDLGNAAIAERLGVSVKTVANYVSTICLRLGVTDRRAAGQLAREAAGH